MECVQLVKNQMSHIATQTYLLVSLSLCIVAQCSLHSAAA